ncbi:hypothetical protein [Pengzhenrongella sp.]|uniref:hypothetical protein n=1 Tax=Pengzhenrongella sp. TaxID=2888820 RepID=UPI002F920294
MNTLFGIIVVLHLIGWAIVLGGTLTNLRTPKIATGVLHGILTALGTGLLMIALAESHAVNESFDMAKIGTKLIIALVVTGLVLFGTSRPKQVSRALVGSIAGLTVVNIAIAVLWN